MKKLTNLIRSSAGRKSVPPYYAHHASQNSKTLENEYNDGIFDFDCEDSTTKQNSPVAESEAAATSQPAADNFAAFSRRQPLNV